MPIAKRKVAGIVPADFLVSVRSEFLAAIGALRARRPMARLALAAALFCVSLMAPAGASANGQITLFPLARNIVPIGIAAGPDGAVWFVENGVNRIGRIATDGTITDYPIPTPNSNPQRITTGPDGALWFSENGAARIGRMTIGGAVTNEFPVPQPRIGRLNGANPLGIATGPDGNLWFAENGADAIGRLTTTGTLNSFLTPLEPTFPDEIVTGSDGALWFTENGATGGAIGRITADGATPTDFPVPTSNPEVLSIASGSDGALWFTEHNAAKVGRITTGGVLTEFPVPSDPARIAAGCDGALWFTQGATNQIGRLTTDGSYTGFPITGGNNNPDHITSGPDGAIWFTYQDPPSIGRITTDAQCSGVEGEQAPSNRFTVVPRITCAGTCRVILIRIVFDSAGRVVIEEVLPGQQRPLSSGAAPRKKTKKSKRQVKTLKKKVHKGANTLRLKLTATGFKKLKKNHKLKLRLKFRFTPTGGRAKTSIKRLIVRLPKRTGKKHHRLP